MVEAVVAVPEGAIRVTVDFGASSCFFSSPDGLGLA